MVNKNIKIWLTQLLIGKANIQTQRDVTTHPAHWLNLNRLKISNVDENEPSRMAYGRGNWYTCLTPSKEVEDM